MFESSNCVDSRIVQWHAMRAMLNDNKLPTNSKTFIETIDQLSLPILVKPVLGSKNNFGQRFLG